MNQFVDILFMQPAGKWYPTKLIFFINFFFDPGTIKKNGIFLLFLTKNRVPF